MGLHPEGAALRTRARKTRPKPSAVRGLARRLRCLRCLRAAPRPHTAPHAACTRARRANARRANACLQCRRSRASALPQVYGILCAQMTLTTLVCSMVMYDARSAEYIFAHPSVQLLSFVLPMLGLFPLYVYRQSHPTNLVLLGLWTGALSVGIGICCAMYPSVVVLQALVLTAAITLSLTAYTFWATNNGKEFDFMGPWLFSTLVALIVVSLLGLFLPMGSGMQLLLAFVGAVLFSACACWLCWLAAASLDAMKLSLCALTRVRDACALTRRCRASCARRHRV